MRHDNNNLPPFAEQIFTPTESVIGEQIEQQNIQEILDEFKQIVPSNFIKLEINYMCSTTDWKEPICERYGFLINGEWKQIDITQELMKKLGLEKGNINYPFYLNNETLNKVSTYGAITIENETEIFLDRPLTINNLETELKRIFAEIEILKTKISELENNNQNQQNSIIDLQQERDNLIIRVSQLEDLLTQTQTNSESEIKKLKDWIKQVKFELVPLFWPNSVCTEDTPTAEILVREIKTKINNLTSEVNRLSQRPTEEQLQENQRQINELNNRLSNLTQQNSAKEIQIINLTNERVRLREELERERGWWEKWINDGKELMIFEKGDYGGDRIDIRIKTPNSESKYDWEHICYMIAKKDQAGKMDFQYVFPTIDKNYWERVIDQKKLKEVFKEKIYQYYLNK